METPKLEKNKAEIIKERIQDLKLLLENHSDEIPERMISGSGNNKVRGNWFTGFFNSLDYVIIECGISDPTIKTDMETFYEKFKKRRQEWIDARLAGTAQGDYLRTTREEIDTANNLLKRTIQDLQNSL